MTYRNLSRKSQQFYNRTAYNEPSAGNACGFRKVAFTKPANEPGNEKKQQVKPLPTLPRRQAGGR